MEKLQLNNPQYSRLQAAFKEWLDTLGYAPTTVYNLPNMLVEFLHYLEQQNISHIQQASPKVVRHYFSLLSQHPNKRRGGGLSHQHLNKHLQALKLFSQYLQQAHNILFSVPIKALVASKKKVVVLNRKEVECLYETALQNAFLKWRDIAMLDVYYGCGLRRKEGAQLRLEDIDLVQNRLLVRHGKGNKQRLVPFTQQAARNFKNYLIYFRNPIIKANERAFFVSGSGKSVGDQALFIRLKRLQKLSEQSSLQQKKIGLHTLRHSIATHLLQGGMKLSYIQQFLGHSSLDSTQIYTHLIHEL